MEFSTSLEELLAYWKRQLQGRPTVLTDAELRQVLVDWNATQTSYLQNRCLHELFEEQVLRTPEAIAVVFGEQQLTYQALNARADQLAYHLRQRGVGPEVFVGVYIERSLEVVVGLLGILKAGGVYVPLDMSSPKERLALLIEETRMPVLLTQQSFVKRLPAFPRSSCHIIYLDIYEANTQQRSVNSVGGSTAENLAYMIYTSGSTGQPKGVMISHRAVCNRLLWLCDVIRLHGSDSVLQKTPLSFDVSIGEIFLALLSGSRLIIARSEGHGDNAYLTQLIETQGVTFLHFVPSMLQRFVEEGEDIGMRCTSIRYVWCGGEALPQKLLKKAASFLLFKAAFYNGYGPTEAAIGVSAWKCENVRDEGPPQSIVPIGRPIANTCLYILDRYLNPTPTSIPGEIYIGGVPLARGYLNHPALTAEKFIPNPFSSEPGTRLYRTGDTARYLADGTIEFLGRIDTQVKIHGLRIELEEIEAIVSRHSAVQQVAVTAHNDSSDEKYLVAYIVPAKKSKITSSELRNFSLEKLPAYMVPSLFVFLEHLPLTLNGKVDRRLLPKPERRATPSVDLFAAPRSELEQIIAAIWCEVLNVEAVNIDDNFFDLGGHSLLMFKVQSRLWERCSRTLSLMNLFEHPSIRSLAEYLLSEELNEQAHLRPIHERAKRQAEAIHHRRRKG